MLSSKKSYIISIILHLTIIWSFYSLTSAELADYMLDSVNHFPTIYENPKLYNVGAVLSSGDNIVEFSQVIEDMNYKPGYLPAGVTLYAVTVPMNANPIRTAQSVCDKLIASQVYAVIVSHSSIEDQSPASVSFTCGFYNIPVIGISNRDSTLSNKNLHASFIRIIAPYSHQADVWTQILIKLEYSSVVFIHSADSDGRTTLGRFQNLADISNIKVESIIEYEPGISDIAHELQEAKNDLYCRVFILYANSEDAEIIFQEIESKNMTDSGYVWLVSEQALQASNIPNGVLGLRLNSTNETSMIRDSVSVLTNALKEMYLRENITVPPADCGRISLNKWESGINFLKHLKNQTLNGKTGRIAFDEFGDRLLSDYEILNIINGKEEVVGKYAFSKAHMKMNLDLNLNNIVWPGNQKLKPLGYFVPKHLKVVTLAEKPFVWIKPTDKKGNCKSEQIPCPRFNSTVGNYRNDCCEGYCMDLLKELSKRLNFTYELQQVEDGQYGSFDFVDGWDQPKRWTGLVGELVYKRADMIAAPLSTNPDRSQVIDFSKPFKYEGITILQKRQPRKATLASFLQPFQNTLWVLVLVSVHVVALALYLLDRFSPFGGFKMDNVVPSDEGALNLSSAIWFSWGVLLNSGIGERTPRSFSARVLGMVWAGFAMIVVASYTANLAAFLVLNPRDDHAVSGIEDSRLRNPTESFTFATVKGSAVEMFFRSQVHLFNAYRTMEETNRDSPEDAILALKSGEPIELDAFIWDSPRLEYEAAQDCDLVISGEPFGRSGYGVGLQKNSFWTEKVTLALLQMHESGYMESLDNKWILLSEKDCDGKNEHFPYTLGMKNMAGVFILVFSGIVVAFGLIVIEIIYKKRRARKLRRLAIAKKLAIKWRLRVQSRKSLYSNLYSAFPLLSRDLSMNKSFDLESRSSTPCDPNIDRIPPPPPPPLAKPMYTYSQPKISAQQKIYEYKQRRSLGYY